MPTIEIPPEYVLARDVDTANDPDRVVLSGEIIFERR